MIPQETIEQVAAANDIVEVIGSYVPLKRAGANFMALCPFHREKSPSFNVSPSRQSFKCFGCGAGGTVFKFITLYENIEFPAAVRRLAERAGIPIIEEQWGPPRRGPRRGGVAPTPARAPCGGRRVVSPQPDEKPGSAGRARLPQVTWALAGGRRELEDWLRAGRVGSLSQMGGGTWL